VFGKGCQPSPTQALTPPHSRGLCVGKFQGDLNRSRRAPPAAPRDTLGVAPGVIELGSVLAAHINCRLCDKRHTTSLRRPSSTDSGPLPNHSRACTVCSAAYAAWR